MGWVMLRMLQLMYSKDDLQVEDKTFGVRQFFQVSRALRRVVAMEYVYNAKT